MEANADYRKAFIVNIEGDTLDFDYLLEHMIYIKEDKENEENLIAIREFIRKKKAVKRIQKPSGKFQKRDYSRELM